jgi:hypothetical protein
MCATNFKTFQMETSMPKVEEWLEILEQFERMTKELKAWGTMSEVMTKLESNGQDIDLLSRLEELKKDDEAMMMLEDLWQDEGLMEIGNQRYKTDRRLRELLQEELHQRNNHWYWDGYEFQKERLRFRIFTCFRRFRDTTGPVRSEWSRLYGEYEGLRRALGIEYTETSPEQAWLAWAEANGELTGVEVLVNKKLLTTRHFASLKDIAL